MMSLDIPSLQQAIHDLENSLDRLEIWLTAMTGLVVLGLVLEYWHEIPEAIAKLKQAWSWKSFLVIAGGILITVGVAGELAVQFYASRKDTKLRETNDSVFSILNTKAAEANDRAAKAEERVSENEKETAQLNAVAEEERLARITIEDRVAWRRLTGNQQAKMASRLDSFSGEPVLIQYNTNDLEANLFALDIATALRQAKWRVSEPLAILKMREGPVPLGTNPPLETGVIVVSTSDQTSHNAADKIQLILKQFGFDATRRPEDDKRPNSMVFILVEHRPEGSQGKAKLRPKADRKTKEK